MNKKATLPKRWIKTPLDCVLKKFESGGRPKGGVKHIKSGIPSIGGEHLTSDGRFNFETIRYIPVEFFIEMTKGKIQKGDVLIVKDGATTGKTAVVRSDFPYGKAAVNEHVFIARSFQEITNLYLFYYLYSPYGQDYVKKSFKGTAQGGINLTFAKDTYIPLAPLSEQHRIVAKIEELFTKLDAGIEAFEKIKAQLKRYRQAILKYALEGKLTTEWRRKNQSSFKQWKRVKLCDCTERITKGESPTWQGYPYVEDGVHFIRSENVLWGQIDLSSVVKIPFDFHDKLKRSQLKVDDVLINLVGASIGRCCVLPAAVRKANINQAVALIRTDNELNSKFLMHLLLTPDIQERIHKGKVETARPNISLTDLRQLEIPLPHLEEQHQIVEEIEWRFSVAAEIEKTVEQSLKKANRLSLSILKKAFEGKLVPQDPDDEPAEKLLERIKAEKTKFEQQKSATKKRKRKPKQRR